MLEINKNIQLILSNLSDKPGIYKFYDDTGTIIYVGKAKNLKKRVSSYFHKEKKESGKINVLVKKISDIHYTVVDTEFDALLLENNLIKELQPRYNVLLKDDKTYPWICIKKERFPRIFQTRNMIKDGSSYFGPYASVKMLNMLLDLIHQLFPLRNCNFLLTPENINAGKFRVCLEYHIHNCNGPCEAKQSEEDYNLNISHIHDILKGNINTVMKQLNVLMKKYSEELQYEKAQVVKEKIELMEKYQSKSTMVNPAISNVDVFSVVSNETHGYVNFLKVIDGAIIQTHSVEIKKKLEEPDEELLSLTMIEFRERYGSDSKEVIVPFSPETPIPGVVYTIPQKGDKKQLLDLSIRNARYYMIDKQKRKELINPERHSKRILAQAMKDLRLKELPNHIECFDNSNIQGSFPVAAMVVFKNGRPAKKDYRHFNIKTVEGPNDFASMEEVVFRRYKRMLEENQALPQLIIVDGGKGQLSSALKSLEKLGLRGKIGIIGIAKKLEEIYYPGDTLPLYLDKKSETLKLIQQLRDEAHRFGITHHRNKREKALISSQLENIENIGEKTILTLLRKFKSVNNIKVSTLEELQKVAGKSKGKIIFDYFKKEK
ncbi:MAG TPA: excinuclease ABC subunit UvrC [Bacteroidales bacterium]|nr:excinuclease ABC subunit UvrC [Bacteroidales bacterium]HQI45860.1 excinuclease ABC subunit UvrC [Bacteroidales bacterium]